MSKARRLAAATAAVVVVGAGALAGCGGGGEEEPLSDRAYIEKVNDAQSSFVGKMASVTQSGATQAQLPGKLNELADEVEGLTGRLDEIKPPEEVSSDHDALQRTLRNYATVLRDLAKAVASKDKARIRRSAQAWQQATQRTQERSQQSLTRINQRLEP